MTKTEYLNAICHHFSFDGNFRSAKPYGDGHINDTYLVTYVDAFEEPTHYILQRVNHLIFEDVPALMSNIESVTSYLSDIITEDEQCEGYEVLTLVKTNSGSSFYKDTDGNHWRSYVFVEGATGHTFAKTPDMLYEAGKAFGQFQKLLKDYPVKSLHETIKGFHHTVNRYNNFESLIKKDPHGRVINCQDDIAFVRAHKYLVPMIVDALDDGSVPYRVTHNDTKINNVLLDNRSGIGRCVIDLDTVMPGSALYDYGDAIRSCSSTVAEDEEDLSLLKLDFQRYDAYTKGFLMTLGKDLTDKEYELLPYAGMIMTLECGMRFLTDYIDGDHYFKVHKDQHNLIRAKNQFKLVEEMMQHLSNLKNIINQYR